MLENDIQKDFYNRTYSIEKSFTPELITEDNLRALLKSGYSMIDDSVLEKSQTVDRSHLIKKEVWASRNGKNFKQTVYVRKDEPEKEYQAEVGEELSPVVKGMKIEKYSDKAFLITGDTFVNKDELKAIKDEIGVGSWNRQKQGWFFPIKFLDTVLAKLWQGQKEKGNDEKADAIQNQKNESLKTGDTVDLGGIEGKVDEGNSDSDGTKYNISLNDGTKLEGVDEKTINTKPQTDDKKISDIVNNATAENRVKTEKQLYGLKSIKDLHNYTLEEVFSMHGIDQEDISKFIGAINKGQSGDEKKTRSGGSSSDTKKESSKIEGLTKRQLMMKLYFAHYQALKKAIEEGKDVKEGALELHPDLQSLYSEKRKAMSEETKRKISEALKKNKPEEVDNLPKKTLNEVKKSFSGAENALIKEEQSKLAEMIVEKERIKKEKYLLWEKGRSTTDYKEKEVFDSQARELSKKEGQLEKEIRNQSNIVQAISNGGTLIEVKDKVGVSYSNVPDFTKVDTSDISYNIDTILTEDKPYYIPEISEEDFKRGSYIFDMIKVGSDQYLLATNKYKESSIVDHGYTKTNDGEYDPKGGGFVMLTLDQVVLAQDYYTTKQKAIFKKEAEDKNKRQEDNWDKKDDLVKEKYLMQRGIYRSLPAKIKKEISESKWDNMPWQEREKYYKPIKKYGTERLKSNFDNKHMASSFHSMYERFVDPEAKRKDKNGKILQRGESTYGQSYAHADAWESWTTFRETLDWKINDINIQREEYSNVRKQALETSYGESNTNNILQKEYGILVKRQNGEQIKPQEIEQLKDAWVDVQKSFGKLTENAKNDNLKLSHAGKTYMFASKAIGVYVPSYKTIGVTNKVGEDQLGFTMGHEVAHWIDHTLGVKEGRRHLSDNYESTAGRIAVTFRKNLNKETDSKYLNATHECFARAMEQYNAVELKGEDTLRAGRDTYFASGEYINKKVYETQLKPLIKQFLEENKEVLKSTLFDLIK